MKNTAFFLLLFTSIQATAQYYYKDLVGTAETNNLLKLYAANKVQSVSLKSYDADGSVSENFAVEQSVIPAQNILKTTTRSGVTDESVLNAWFDEKGRLLKTVDTSGSTVNTAIYSYDQQERLVSVKSFSGDTLHGSTIEDHQWFYNNDGRPVEMLRIINNKDTSAVKLVLDEKGNVIQEALYKKGKSADPVYYYYNDKNRMTDIVRYNYKLKKLLPDYMFEYSEGGQLIQKITVPANKASAYLIWRYQYDSKGLKIREACFTSDKQLTGKIEYAYRFGN